MRFYGWTGICSYFEFAWRDASGTGRQMTKSHPLLNSNDIHVGIIFIRPAILLILSASMLFPKDRYDRWDVLYSGTGPDYQDVRFPDAMNGFISHSGGMLKTTDGGESWSEMDAATGPRPGTFEFADRAIGYGIGGGDILKSSNGGTTWVNLGLSNLGEWLSISTANRDTVYASGGSWNYPNSAGTVNRSIDGGAHWTTVLETNESIYGVYFLTGRFGFAWQLDKLYRTENGGIDWKVVPLKDTFIGCISFRDAQTGFLAGRDSLWASTDSGQTWGLAQANLRAISGILFTSGQTGFAHGPFGVYGTVDGGKNWSKIIVGPLGISSIAFTDSLNGWAVGSKVIQRTNDGGRTWRYQREIMNQSITSMVFSNGSIGHISGPGGLLINTVDGGLHWTNHESGKPFADGGYSGLYFPDALTGFRYSVNQDRDSTEILKTVDGGKSWSPLAMLHRILNSLSFPNARTGYGVASVPGHCSGYSGPLVCAPDTGYFLNSTDYGRNWTELEMPGDAPAFIQCFGSDTCMVMGQHGGFWKTQSGGADGWNEFKSTGLPPNTKWGVPYVRDMHFVTSLVGYAAANIGIYKTTNGGADWAWAAGLSVSSDFNSIRFIDTLIGYGVGSNGIAMRTADGGVTWSSETTGTKDHLFNLDCPVPDTCFAFTHAGGLLRLIRGDEGVGIRRTEKASRFSRIHGRWKYNLSQPTYVSATIYSLDGKRLGGLLDGIQQPGVYELPTPSEQRFGRGARILDFRAGETHVTLRFVSVP
jgi:photosystem II stability/assembly factor-like uncharacterized protein